MNLNEVVLRPLDPKCDFNSIAALMNTVETEPNTAESVAEWYAKKQDDGIWFTVAISADGKILGFNGLYRAKLNRERHYGTYLIVEQASRCFGLGDMLYDNLISQAGRLNALTLHTNVRDTCEEGIRFATRRGFKLKKHSIEMMFYLKRFDDKRYESILENLRNEGFKFTNMADLGDTPAARRKLFTLNNNAAGTDPGADGIKPWASFNEFNRDVCNASWYRPDGQIVAIDSNSGEWAAMSAITVFNQADHAYNLFTGTDVRYRGRKLAQAVKSLALKKALEYGVETVRTSHNSENAVMIAIDTKLGYVRTPGMLIMEKDL